MLIPCLEKSFADYVVFGLIVYDATDKNSLYAGEITLVTGNDLRIYCRIAERSIDSDEIMHPQQDWFVQ